MGGGGRRFALLGAILHASRAAALGAPACGRCRVVGYSLGAQACGRFRAVGRSLGAQASRLPSRSCETGTAISAPFGGRATASKHNRRDRDDRYGRRPAGRLGGPSDGPGDGRECRGADLLRLRRWLRLVGPMGVDGAGHDVQDWIRRTRPEPPAGSESHADGHGVARRGQQDPALRQQHQLRRFRGAAGDAARWWHTTAAGREDPAAIRFAPRRWPAARHGLPSSAALKGIVETVIAQQVQPQAHSAGCKVELK